MAYTALADVRALKTLVDDTAVYTDAQIEEGILYATEVINLDTGVFWETTTSQTVTLDGTGTDRISTGWADLSAVTACTVGGDAQTVTNWVTHPDGQIIRDDGIFDWTTQGQNVVVTATRGLTATIPDDLAHAARQMARWYVIQLHSQTDDNIISSTNEYGSMIFAQPGGRHGPTALPEVNAILKRRRHRFPVLG